MIALNSNKMVCNGVHVLCPCLRSCPCPCASASKCHAVCSYSFTSLHTNANKSEIHRVSNDANAMNDDREQWKQVTLTSMAFPLLHRYNMFSVFFHFSLILDFLSPVPNEFHKLEKVIHWLAAVYFAVIDIFSPHFFLHSTLWLFLSGKSQATLWVAIDCRWFPLLMNFNAIYIDFS